MRKLIVNAASKRYPIYIGESFNGLAGAFNAAGLSGRKACIITDSNVNDIYLNTVRKEIEAEFEAVSVCVFKAGEERKTLDTIQSFYKHFFENKMDRKSVVIALGGGVTGDMAGFAAATYMRGISFVQVPTTLLSQVDSSVGGKTGVDFANAKNIIGAFYQPEFVYININTLKTLPKEQFVSGMGEVVKHGFIRDKRYLDYIAANKNEIISLKEDIMQELVYGSCRIKAEVVALDEKEQGLRETLNFGHTFGHAVESLYNFEMLHGHCVGIGMCAALYLSYLKGGISKEDMENAENIIKSFGLPIIIPEDGIFDEKRILNLMLMDKKTKNGNINLVLLERIGGAYTYKQATEDEILAGILYMKQRGQ